MKMNVGIYRPIYGTVKDKRLSLKNRIKAAFRWFMLRVAIATVFVALLFGVYFYGMAEAANTTTVVNQILPSQAQSIAPILKKIALAESGGHQFNANGLPVMHANTNGSVDIGLYQINNRVWGAKAKALGYDLLTEEGQTKMATWILENRGTDAWNSSKGGWSN